MFAGAVRYRREQATRHLVQPVRDPTRRKRVDGAYPFRRKPRNDLEGVEREEGMKKNICVFTFGGTWEIVPEVLGFLNPEQFPMYRNRKDYVALLKEWKHLGLESVSEIWLVTTDGTANSLNEMERWRKNHADGLLRIREIPSMLSDIATPKDCEHMREVIFRTVLHAVESANGGKVYLSLAGGRKTMSADIQDAGNVFGCSAMLHVISSGNGKVQLPNDASCLSQEDAERITPVVISGERKRAPFLFGEKGIVAKNYPIPIPPDNPCILLEQITKLRQKAGVVLSNFTQDDIQANHGETFRALHYLHPEIIERMRNERIGLGETESDLMWIAGLPKAELHCHFGGILSPEEMLVVADAEAERVAEWEKKSDSFADWLRRIRSAVQSRDIRRLHETATDKGSLRVPVPAVPEPLAVCGFLLCFRESLELLRNIIYGQGNPTMMTGIGIDAYEKMGDLQGSALMQSEACIRAACARLKERCQKSNILYCEVRCSPNNYTRAGLSGREVARILLDELTHGAGKTCFALIFTASRHGKKGKVKETVQLAENLLCEEEFRERLVGFDLAGAEGAAAPNQFRELFDPLLKQCMRITIHAGETESVESIWDAVYSLNADRIGHGLSLAERSELLNRFLDRRIAVELCPSSNFQIVGFKDFRLKCPGRTYPLRTFLNCGLRVTINTDDPGISDTDLNHEYQKAAAMTEGGLSRWDTIRLAYNGFSASFSRYVTRREVLNQAEGMVMKMIGDWYAN